jgi:hypothetical protein
MMGFWLLGDVRRNLCQPGTAEFERPSADVTFIHLKIVMKLAVHWT